MQKIIQLVLTIGIVFGLSYEKVSAATVTWDGGGDNINWTDPLNWDTDALPTTADDVDLNEATVILAASTQVQRIYAGGSSQLTINAGVTLTITGFAGDDDGLEVQGSATVINDGTIAISNITGGTSADGLYNKGTFTNNGSITIDGTGDHGIYAQDGVFTNSSGATISITNVTDDHIIVDDNSGDIAIFNNSGTITITMITGDDGIYVNDGSIFNNSSVINLSAGAGATTDESIYSEDFGAFNNLSGGVVTISSGTDYGLQTKNNGIVNNAGTITIEQMPDHQIWMDGPGAFSNSGTINLNNSISGKNALYITDESIFTNEADGQLDISSASNFSIQIDGNSSTAEVVNNGTITITGGKDGLRLQEGGTFTNNSGGVLNIDAPNEDGINIQSSGGTLNNTGTITISNAPKEGMDMSAGTFNNNNGGIFNAFDNAEDNLEINGTSVVNNDGAMRLYRTGADGSGRDDIENNDATFTNTTNATFAPGASPGEMEVRGDFDLGASTVTFELGGTTHTSEYDRIEIVNASTITLTGATMHLDWGAYTPNVGDKFKVIDGSGTVSGPFATITSTKPNITVTVDYSGDTGAEVEIEVTSLVITCPAPMGLTSSNITETTADLSWDAVSEASGYNWIVVEAGAGATATPVASGNTAMTSATAMSLSDFTSYDFHVQADCGAGDLSTFSTAHNFTTVSSNLTTLTIGEGTSSSSTRGPVQISGGGSTTRFTRFVQIFTATELATAGLAEGSSITEVLWELASENIIQSGTGNFKVYIKNSTATSATSDVWSNLIVGSTLVVDNVYDVNNNFPGMDGWMPFTFTAPFSYTGGALEIAVEWDFSEPTGTGFTSTDGDGIKWRWSSTAPTDLVAKRTGSSGHSSSALSLSNERANIQIAYVPPACAAPINLSATNLTTTTADLSWDAAGSAVSYDWKVVAAGDGSAGTAVASGNVSTAMASATGLTSNTAYDFYVQSNCSGSEVSAFSLAHNFTTLCLTPTGLGTTNITATTADLSWDAITGATSYDWKIVAAGDGTAGTAVALGSTATTMATATGLSSNTSYDLYVQVACGTSNMSDFSAAHNFMTIVATCPTPTGLASTNITQTSADLSWSAASGASNYNWMVIATGDCSAGTVIASGSTATTMVTATGLTGNMIYDFQVQADCGSGDLSDFSATQGFMTTGISTPMLLSANGPGDTYTLMTGELAPGADPLEPPDCNHGDFNSSTNNVGEHIDEVFDADLNKNAFRFHLHVTPDNDRCINFDRQRNEIKTYNESPDNLLGVLGETVEYKWKFKLPVGFQSSARFTHIHQLKSVGASNSEDDMPQITFTTRKGTNGNPDQLELRYAEDLTQITWAQTDLTPFKGQWVEATETVTYGDWGEGVYSLEIKNLSDCSTLLSYSNNSTRMWKTDAAFVRPKWGIYRSLEDAADLRDEEVLFADFSIKELSAVADCAAPTSFLNATSLGFTTADLSWGGVPGATAYNWKIVATGAGSAATAVASGTSLNTTISVTGLTDNTSYDLYVNADCGGGSTTGFSAAYTFMTPEDTGEIKTDPLGTETSSSSSRGPIHQGSTSASTRYSRFYHVFTEAELEAVGLSNDCSITQLEWYITTSDVITGAGDAPFKIYIKNSSATQGVEGDWSTLISDAALVLDRTFNETNNFPGSAGWMPFAFDTPFTYTGGALEVAVEWNWASVAFTNNGSIKWRYSNVANSVVSRALGTSSYATNVAFKSNSTEPMQRANMQIVHIPAPITCPAPTNLNATNITTSATDLSWDAVTEANSYTWKVVEFGAGADGTAVAMGTTAGTSASVSSLDDLTAYDLHVQSDCGGGDIGPFSAAYTFVTAPIAQLSTLTFGTGTDVNSSIGPVHQAGASANTRYSRFNQVFTQSELAAAGLTADSKITELQWYLASANIITLGEAPFKIYIKNSNVTEATPMSWSDLTLGLDPIVDLVFSAGSNATANNHAKSSSNFPGVEGWMPFSFDVPFTYTGGALEVLVEWDWDNAAFTNDGALDWRYSTTPENTVVRKLGAGSHTSSNLSLSTSDTSPPTHRANMQIVFADANALAVEMLDFTGKNTKDGNRLNWITATERNSKGFDVQKSIDSENWETIGFVAGKGTTATANKYEFLDKTPSAITYYRLKQLDDNGSFEYSKTILISTSGGSAIKTYPNPVTNQLTIEDFAGQVTIFNLLGQPQKVFIITNQKQHLPLGDLPAGDYLLEMIGNDGFKTVQQMVKVKE